MAAVPTGITKAIPWIKRLWLPLLNLVGEKNEFRIIATSENYTEFRFLWGVFSFEKGQKIEFVVRGTESYVTSIISSLTANGFDVNRALSHRIR
ncbi:hypothetical protein F4Y93_04920 [Candidatus Poribacteria bacterium]|nr:hypothetical protein [Candidatus Poribacteria bacterium]